MTSILKFDSFESMMEVVKGERIPDDYFGGVDVTAVASLSCPACKEQVFFILPYDDVVEFLEDGRSFPELHLPYLEEDDARRLQDGYCRPCVDNLGKLLLEIPPVKKPREQWFREIGEI